jgi:hypothetical protein
MEMASSTKRHRINIWRGNLRGQFKPDLECNGL